MCETTELRKENHSLKIKVNNLMRSNPDSRYAYRINELKKELSLVKRERNLLRIKIEKKQASIDLWKSKFMKLRDSLDCLKVALKIHSLNSKT